MKKHFLKFGKVFTNIACSHLILISNNSKLAAKYLPQEVEHPIKTLEINDIYNGLFQVSDIKQKKKMILKIKYLTGVVTLLDVRHKVKRIR